MSCDLLKQKGELAGFRMGKLMKKLQLKYVLLVNLRNFESHNFKEGRAPDGTRKTPIYESIVL